MLQYLGRYTHRLAISNHRLGSFSDGQVTFRWRDSAHQNEQKLLTLSISPTSSASATTSGSDAKQFVVQTADHPKPTSITLLTNWAAELKNRAPPTPPMPG